MKMGSACEERMRHQGLVTRTFNIQRKLCGHGSQTGPGFAACGSDLVTSWLAGLSFYLQSTENKPAGPAVSASRSQGIYMRLFRTGAGTRVNTVQMERPSLGLRDPGGAALGEVRSGRLTMGLEPPTLAFR